VYSTDVNPAVISFSVDVHVNETKDGAVDVLL
jgi:hypothetical protein